MTTNNPFANVKADIAAVDGKVSAAVSTVTADAAKVSAEVAAVKADYVAADNAAIAYVKNNPKKIVAAVVSIVGAALSHFVWKIL
jgi:hypothetical protein